jgi:hypothetical protein
VPFHFLAQFRTPDSTMRQCKHTAKHGPDGRKNVVTWK